MVKTVHPIRQLIHGDTDIYAGFDPSPYPFDVFPQWGGGNKLFGELVRQFKPKLIYEVGTWKGASAINMAMAARDAGLDTQIVCIDTWLGDAMTELRGTFADARAALNRKHGYPTIYWDFLANVCHAGVADYITPLAKPSRTAARMLKDYYQKHHFAAELVYIDGSHEREDVADDLEHYWPRLAIGGHMFGHDYGMPSVSLAVKKFAEEKRLDIVVVESEDGGKFWRLFQ